jgi:protein TonB
VLAYEARRSAERRPAPQAMLFIVAAHVSAIALVMSAKMELPQRAIRSITQVTMIPLPKPPPERRPEAPPKPSQSMIDRQPAIVPIPQPPSPPLHAEPVPLPLPGGNVVGSAPIPQPHVEPLPGPAPVRLGPRLATPQSQLRPPYPASKIALGEEAVLKLRLTIDQRGRVTAVEPVGRADPAFLEAARRHLIARWRYKPASEDGRAIASTTVITLRFQLDE